MTATDRARELLELRRKATQGEWSLVKPHPDEAQMFSVTADLATGHTLADCYCYSDEQDEANANLIVAAANHVEEVCEALIASEDNSEVLQCRLDVVTAEYCESLRKLNAAEAKARAMAELVRHCMKEFRTVEARMVSSDRVVDYMEHKLARILGAEETE
jgi:hypothetical protein